MKAQTTPAQAGTAEKQAIWFVARIYVLLLNSAVSVLTAGL